MRPKYYLHFLNLIKRKFYTNKDTEQNKIKALQWASSNAVTYREAMKKLNFKLDLVGLDRATVEEGKNYLKNHV